MFRIRVLPPVAALLGLLLMVSSTAAQTTYTWEPAGTASWAVAANWNPDRTTPATSDILVFDNGATTTATNIPAQTIGKLLISGSTSVTLQPNSAGLTLSIGGGTGTDLEVQSGSSLGVTGANQLRIVITSGATASVSGAMSVAGGPHRVVAQGASSNRLEFLSGAVFSTQTGFTGSVFGDGTGDSGPLSVIFRSGSLYAHGAGSTPFGGSGATTVVTFEAGSRYRHDTTAVTPAMSGRTYADFEYNAPGSVTVIGSSALTLDDLIVSQGTFNCNMTGAFSLRGDINVATGATLNFNPASGTPAIALNGLAAQTITVDGTMSCTTNESFQLNNATGVSIATNVTWPGSLNFVSGRISTGANVLALGASSNVTGASGSTGWVSGNLRRNLPPTGGEVTRAFDIGDATVYSPVTVAIHGLAAAFDLLASATTPDHPNIGSSTLNPTQSVNRYWTLTPSGSPTFTNYDATFNFASADVDGGADTSVFDVQRYNGSTWSTTTTGTRTSTSTQATGVTAFSDFAIGEVGTTHTITASAGAGGSISPSGAVVVNDGDDQAFTITADPGYDILDVLVDGVSQGAVPSYTFTDVALDHTIAASFVLETYTITASAGTGGSISPSGAVMVNYGDDPMFTITADPGYDILDVLVDGVSQGAVPSYTFTDVALDHTIAASFALETYTITATAGTGGSISPSGAVVVNYGDDPMFTITADPGYDILDVLVDGVSQGAVSSYTFTDVALDHTIAASFVLETYTITATAGTGGSISPSGAVVVNYGDDPMFTITADPGYDILDVLVDGVSQGAVPSYTFTDVALDHTIAASFALETYTITATAGTGGSISPSGAVVVNYGDDPMFTITADPGYDILDVLVDGVSQGAVSSYTFTDVALDHTIAASFVLETYTITATAGTGGSISPSGAVVVNYGDDPMFTITADPGYDILDVLVDGVSQGAVPSYTFTDVALDHTIDASFGATPVVTGTFIANLSLGHTDDYIKNGQSARLTATITHPGPGFGIGNIRADLTGLGGGSSVAPDSYASSTATWDLAAVTCAPADGLVTLVITATDPLGGPSGMGSDSIIADNTAPMALAGLVAAPGHAKVNLAWTNAFDNDPTAYYGVQIRFRRWTDYPEYGAGEPVYPTSPIDGDGTAFDGTGNIAAAVHSRPFATQRDIYYYSGFVYDIAMNFSVEAAAHDARATSYWLGDFCGVSAGDTLYNGLVDVSDLSVLGSAFGLSAPAWPLNEADVGPTHDGSRAGIPTPDDLVDFEDLMVVAMNFGLVSPARTPPVSSEAARFTWTRLDDTTWSLGLAAPCAALKGVRLWADLPSGATASVTAGSLLGEQTAPFFLRNLEQHGLDASLALLGVDAGFQGQGELLRVVLPAELDAADVQLVARSTDNTILDSSLDAATAVDSPPPLAFEMQQNHPNPFNPATTIRFALPDAQPVRLTIYALDGRRVTTLLDEPRAAGRHEVVWRGTDDGGRLVASGTYIYRIQAGPYLLTRKMSLMK